MNFIVDGLRAAIFAAGHVLGGSLGAGIVAVSATLRLALLPVTLRLARRARAQQRILRSLQPELKLIAARHAKAPDALWREQQALYQRAGYKAFDSGAFFGNLAQWPLLGGMFAALRRGLGAAGFLWIADLGRPDALLALLVSAAAGLAAWLGADPAVTSTKAQAGYAAFGTLLMLAFCWKLSAALALSWGASSAVSAVQGVLLRRDERRT